jgi:hypothetical protein
MSAQRIDEVVLVNTEGSHRKGKRHAEAVLTVRA